MLCEPIAPKRRLSQAPLKTTTCYLGCGATVKFRTTPRVICDACYPAHRAEQMRQVAERIRRKRGVAKVKDTQVNCNRCSTAFIRNGIRARYCPECARKVYVQRARDASIRKAASVEGRSYNNQWARNRRKTDPKWSLSTHMRGLIHRAFGKGKAGRSWRSFVPYSLDELAQHLERQFLPGMSWDNRSKWHIDHIRPLASFEFHSPECAGFKQAWALTNLRPLWAADNFRKSAKLDHLI